MPGERLLPCPFCGSPAILNKDIYNFYHVRCGSNCIPSIGGYREPGLAVANWNRRAIPVEESQHVNQQLKAEIAACVDRYLVAINKPYCSIELSDFIKELRQLSAV